VVVKPGPSSELKVPLRVKNQTVGILRGEFAKSREPSDLAEEQGSYDKYSFK
jgi:hypothetical protein